MLLDKMFAQFENLMLWTLFGELGGSTKFLFPTLRQKRNPRYAKSNK